MIGRGFVYIKICIQIQKLYFISSWSLFFLFFLKSPPPPTSFHPPLMCGSCEARLRDCARYPPFPACAERWLSTVFLLFLYLSFLIVDSTGSFFFFLRSGGAVCVVNSPASSTFMCWRASHDTAPTKKNWGGGAGRGVEDMRRTFFLQSLKCQMPPPPLLPALRIEGDLRLRHHPTTQWSHATSRRPPPSPGRIQISPATLRNTRPFTSSSATPHPPPAPSTPPSSPVLSLLLSFLLFFPSLRVPTFATSFFPGFFSFVGLERVALVSRTTSLPRFSLHFLSAPPLFFQRSEEDYSRRREKKKGAEARNPPPHPRTCVECVNY